MFILFKKLCQIGEHNIPKDVTDISNRIKNPTIRIIKNPTI
jgi:hypothetical protein